MAALTVDYNKSRIINVLEAQLKYLSVKYLLNLNEKKMLKMLNLCKSKHCLMDIK